MSPVQNHSATRCRFIQEGFKPCSLIPVPLHPTKKSLSPFSKVPIDHVCQIHPEGAIGHVHTGPCFHLGWSKHGVLDQDRSSGRVPESKGQTANCLFVREKCYLSRLTKAFLMLENANSVVQPACRFVFASTS